MAANVGSAVVLEFIFGFFTSPVLQERKSMNDTSAINSIVKAFIKIISQSFRSWMLR